MRFLSILWTTTLHWTISPHLLVQHWLRCQHLPVPVAILSGHVGVLPVRWRWPGQPRCGPLPFAPSSHSTDHRQWCPQFRAHWFGWQWPSSAAAQWPQSPFRPGLSPILQFGSLYRRCGRARWPAHGYCCPNKWSQSGDGQDRHVTECRHWPNGQLLIAAQSPTQSLLELGRQPNQSVQCKRIGYLLFSIAMTIVH